MRENSICPVCGRDASFIPDMNFDPDMVSCKKCGRYLVTDYALGYIADQKIKSEKFYACLYYYLTHYRKSKKKYSIQEKAFADDEQYHRVTVDEIMNLYPKTISERIDMAMLNFSEFCEELGSEIEIPVSHYYIPIVFAKTHSEAEYLFSVMVNMGFVTEQNGEWGPDKPMRFKILYKGWERIDELQKEKTTRNQGFIAMWFNPTMSKIEMAIKQAIENAHYLPMKIDEKEHNNQIVPEILYEIKKSDFIVADLSENRGGVYYEAGYALALGKEVILTVDETKEEPHFDVAQKNQVRYKTPEELTEKLTKRILATVGDKNDKN